MPQAWRDEVTRSQRLDVFLEGDGVSRAGLRIAGLRKRVVLVVWGTERPA